MESGRSLETLISGEMHAPLLGTRRGTSPPNTALRATPSAAVCVLPYTLHTPFARRVASALAYVDAFAVALLFAAHATHDSHAFSLVEEWRSFQWDRSLVDLAFLSIFRSILLGYYLVLRPIAFEVALLVALFTTQIYLMIRIPFIEADTYNMNTVMMLAHMFVMGIVEIAYVDAMRKKPWLQNVLPYPIHAIATNSDNYSNIVELNAREEIQNFAANAVKKLESLQSSALQMEWTSFSDGSGYAKVVEGNLVTCMGVGTVAMSPIAVQKFLLSLEFRNVIDFNYENVQIIEAIDRDSRLLHIKYCSFWPISARDATVVEISSTLANGDLVVAYTSVRHDSTPIQEKYIRMEYICAGWIISSTPEQNQTRLTHIVQADLGGSLPKFYVDHIATKFPLSIERIRRFVESHPSVIVDIEREATNPTQSIFQTTLTDVRVPRHPTAAPVATLSDSESSPKLISDVLPEAHQLKPLYASLSSQAFSQFYEALDSPWIKHGEVDNVVIYRKNAALGGVSPFKGVGVINAPPYDVFRLVTNIVRRREWDPMYKEGAVVEVLDENHRILYISFEAQLLTWPRDFCVIEARRIDTQKNQYHIAFLSTSHPSAPEFSGYVRGEVLYGGYKIEAGPNPGQTSFCYCLALNPRGWIPVSVSNSVISKQPLVISLLRDILSKSNSRSTSNDPLAKVSQSSPGLALSSDSRRMRLSRSESFRSTLMSPELRRRMAYVDKMENLQLKIVAEIDPFSADNWKTHGVLHGIDISVKESASARYIKGSCVFGFSVNHVHWFITQMDKRSDWEPLFQSAELIEKIAPTLSVFNVKYKAAFPLPARDYCLCFVESVLQSGFHVYAASSVPHPKCPADSAYNREEISTWAIVLKPIGECETLVTYVVECSVQNTLSAKMNPTLSVKQPLVLASLQTAMELHRSTIPSDFEPHEACYRPIRQAITSPPVSVAGRRWSTTSSIESDSGYVSFDDGEIVSD
eukprot:TRINITY_DN6171_c1_g1_i3.p1 TRINITY_DN6171_c1_g1~~TRINITY_DN6171_c1_g1_i3.p1  ORF type:complete len:1024 (+),score=176.13 TRINITY_DN6171_c1_g1_i3:140-3073(+)